MEKRKIQYDTHFIKNVQKLKEKVYEKYSDRLTCGISSNLNSSTLIYFYNEDIYSLNVVLN